MLLESVNLLEGTKERQEFLLEHVHQFCLHCAQGWFSARASGSVKPKRKITPYRIKLMYIHTLITPSEKTIAKIFF